MKDFKSDAWKMRFYLGSTCTPFPSSLVPHHHRKGLSQNVCEHSVIIHCTGRYESGCGERKFDAASIGETGNVPRR
jgi:hypothetical protein